MKKLILILIVAAAIFSGCEKGCKCYKVDVEIEYYPNPHIIKADTTRAIFKDCGCDGLKEDVVWIHESNYSGSTYTEYFCE